MNLSAPFIVRPVATLLLSVAILLVGALSFGLLPVALDRATVDQIAQADTVEVDLEAQEVRWPGGTASFEIDAEIKHRLLNGLDDIAMTLQQEDALSAYEAERERSGPVTTAL